MGERVQALELDEPESASSLPLISCMLFCILCYMSSLGLSVFIFSNRITFYCTK